MYLWIFGISRRGLAAFRWGLSTARLSDTESASGRDMSLLSFFFHLNEWDVDWNSFLMQIPCPIPWCEQTLKSRPAASMHYIVGHSSGLHVMLYVPTDHRGQRRWTSWPLSKKGDIHRVWIRCRFRAANPQNKICMQKSASISVDFAANLSKSCRKSAAKSTQIGA